MLLGQEIAQSRMSVKTGFTGDLRVHLDPELVEIPFCRLHCFGILASLAFVDRVVKPPIRHVTGCDHHNGVPFISNFMHHLGFLFIVRLQVAVMRSHFTEKRGSSGLVKGDLVSAFSQNGQVCDYASHSRSNQGPDTWLLYCFEDS